MGVCTLADVRAYIMDAVDRLAMVPREQRARSRNDWKRPLGVDWYKGDGHWVEKKKGKRDM